MKIQELQNKLREELQTILNNIGFDPYADDLIHEAEEIEAELRRLRMIGNFLNDKVTITHPWLLTVVKDTTTLYYDGKLSGEKFEGSYYVLRWLAEGLDCEEHNDVWVRLLCKN